jgi:GTP pyrophosphokinase
VFTVIGPEQQRVEMQIRTREMHEIAEHGVAAHWAYKDRGPSEGNGEAKDASDYDPSKFLNRVTEILDHASSPEEFLEHTKLEMFLDQVFCFTPKGDLIALPLGASPVDFAYAVHTRVGDTCVGAKVNGITVPLHTQLMNGDSVEILRSRAQNPEPSWEGMVVTGKARAAIRRFVRESERSEFVRLGMELVEQLFRKEQQELTEKGLEFAAKRLNCENGDEVLLSVGKGHITAQDVLVAVYPGIRSRARRARESIRRVVGRRPTSPKAIPIKGLTPGLAVHMSECCYPINGDRIVGIAEADKGINVHTIDCAKLEEHQESQDQWIDLSWETETDEVVHMVGRIRVVLHNESGALGALCTRIADYDGNISNILISERRSDFFDVIVDIEVEDLKHLTHIVAALRANPLIESVRRVRG